MAKEDKIGIHLQTVGGWKYVRQIIIGELIDRSQILLGVLESNGDFLCVRFILGSFDPMNFSLAW